MTLGRRGFSKEKPIQKLNRLDNNLTFLLVYLERKSFINFTKASTDDRGQAL